MNPARVDFAALKARKAQVVRKRSLRRVLRLLMLRGSAWYHGRRYVTSEVLELVEHATWTDLVKQLHAQDRDVTEDVLVEQGLWSIVRPPANVYWRSETVVIEAEPGHLEARFGLSFPRRTSPRSTRR